MRSENAFLQDVLDHPDDVGPRLIYADWLEEHDDAEALARAEFIRAQCELEDLPAGDRRRGPLRRRVLELLKTHRKRWTAPLREARLGKKWEFRRGFVEGVTMSATHFVGTAGRLFRLAPIRAVRCPDASNEVSALAKSPHLARLRSLDIGYMCVCGRCPIHMELRQLFASRHVANLTTLVVSGDRISAEGARQLAGSSRLARLTTLDLSSNRLRTEGLRALIDSPHLRHLKILRLGANDIAPGGARGLASWPRLSSLSELDLRSNRIGDAGARALAESPYLSPDVRLRLSDNEISDKGVEALRTRLGWRAAAALR